MIRAAFPAGGSVVSRKAACRLCRLVSLSSRALPERQVYFRPRPSCSFRESASKRSWPCRRNIGTAVRDGEVGSTASGKHALLKSKRPRNEISALLVPPGTATPPRSGNVSSRLGPLWRRPSCSSQFLRTSREGCASGTFPRNVSCTFTAHFWLRSPLPRPAGYHYVQISPSIRSSFGYFAM